MSFLMTIRPSDQMQTGFYRDRKAEKNELKFNFI